MILTLQKTIPSNSHNAPFDEQHGSHWPVGQQFKTLPREQQRQYSHRWLKDTETMVEQIGGEEVLLIFPTEKMAELFGV